MKKVCHITSAHSQRDIRILLKECVSLSKEYDVHLVVLNGKEEVYGQVKIHTAHCSIQKRMDRFTKGVKAVYELALSVDADVYHLHDPELLRVATKLKKRGKIVIFDSHENLPSQIKGKYWINKYLRNFVAAAAHFYENKTVRKIDAVVTATPSIAERFDGIAKIVRTVNNFPFLNELAATTDWGNKKNEACYIGGITAIRGCTEMIQAFEHCSTIRLNMAGNYSPESYRQELITLKGWKAVNEFGLVDRDEVAKIMNHSKYGIVVFQPFLNHIEAQPNKMFEYMSAGIPIVASNFPLWKQIIEGNHCGVCVDPTQPSEIKNALEYLRDNDEEAKKMGENGRNAVVEKYNWEQEQNQLLDLYKELLD